MFRDADSVIREGLELSPEDRVRVAERLLESLPDDEISQAWLMEAERRKALWDSGSVVGIDGDEVIQGLRDRARG